MTTKNLETDLLTLPEVAELLRVTPRAIYYLVHGRKIPHLKLGRSLRFDRLEIDQWLRKQRVPAVAA